MKWLTFQDQLTTFTSDTTDRGKELVGGAKIETTIKGVPDDKAHFFHSFMRLAIPMMYNYTMFPQPGMANDVKMKASSFNSMLEAVLPGFGGDFDFGAD